MSAVDPIVLNPTASARGWHRLQTFAECPQRYAWTYLLDEKRAVTDRPALAVGSLLHTALAQHYIRMRQEQQGKNPDEYLEPIEAVRLIAQVRGWMAHVDKVVPTYVAYKTAYIRDIYERIIEGVEELYDGTVGPYRLTGRIDLRWRDLGGQLHTTDHKSTGRLTTQHKHVFTLSGQFQAYAHLVRQRHGDLASFEINMMQHTNPKFMRLPLPRSPFFEQQFISRVLDLEHGIERLVQEDRQVGDWPKAMSELTCYHRYGACDFVDKCRFGPKAACAGSFTVDFGQTVAKTRNSQ